MNSSLLYSPGSRMVYSRLGVKVLASTSLRKGLAADKRNPCTLTWKKKNVSNFGTSIWYS